MKQLFFLLSILFFHCAAGIAQNIDQLKKQYQQQTDSQKKADLLLNLGKAYEKKT